MARLIKSDRTWATNENLDEWLVKDADDLANVDDTAGPGSMAYTANMNFMAQKDEDGTWQTVIMTTPDE